jgi:hypothetical protein
MSNLNMTVARHSSFADLLLCLVMKLKTNHHDIPQRLPTISQVAHRRATIRSSERPCAISKTLGAALTSNKNTPRIVKFVRSSLKASSLDGRFGMNIMMALLHRTCFDGSGFLNFSERSS